MSEEKLISYEELFGNLDYSSADECRSVIAPAAYLTDIMNLKNWEYDSGNITKEDAVDDRREDISDILLDDENTKTEIPYLDIVNQIMENRISKEIKEADPYERLKNTAFPTNLPFNLHKTEINEMIRYLKTDATKLYKAFAPIPKIELVASEYLGLSEEDVRIIETEITDHKILMEKYGMKEGETFEDLSKCDRFRKATGLSVLELKELLFQNLSDSEIKNGVSQRFFINGSSSGNGYLILVRNDDKENELLRVRSQLSDGKEKESIPSEEYFERINRFIRLARKTELSFTDLDTILTTSCNASITTDAIPIIAAIKWLKNIFELQIDEICAFFSVIKQYGKGTGTLPEDLYNRIFNNTYDKSISEIFETDKTAFNGRLQACLECTEPEFNKLKEIIEAAGKQLNPTPSGLSLPYRIKKLSTLCGITIENLFKLFRLINKNLSSIQTVRLPLMFDFSATMNKCEEIIFSENNSRKDTLQRTKNILWLIQFSIALMKWTKDNGMSVEQIEFICYDDFSLVVEGVPSREEVEELLRDINGQCRTQLLNKESLLSGVTDTVTAAALFNHISNSESGICSENGIIKRSITAKQLRQVYTKALREKLFLTIEDFEKTGLSKDLLNELLGVMKNRNHIDDEGYINTDDANLTFFANSGNGDAFLPEADRTAATAIFNIVSERIKIYSSIEGSIFSECTIIEEKIKEHASRQRSLLFLSLESSLGISSDVIEVLCNTLFRSYDEPEEMGVAHFILPIMDAFDKEASVGGTLLDALFLISFRRLLRFGLLSTKTGLTARELETLFFIKEIQNTIPEKLKVPHQFNQRIDALFGDAERNIYLFSGENYICYSGTNQSISKIGNINELPEIPKEFKTSITAAVRDWAPQEKERKTYFFSKNSFCNAESPEKVVSTMEYWGKVRNNIFDSNTIDAALRTDDGTLYLFSGDQYVRYSDKSRKYVDEGYPKLIARNWNDENRVRLPFEIRKKIDAVFIDTDKRACFFSNTSFIDSSNPSDVQKTADRWARVVNNIADGNRIDATFTKDDKTFMFSADQYIRYSTKDYSIVDEGYPLKIENNWNKEGIKELSGEYLKRIDAAICGTDGHVYLFNGNTFICSDNDVLPTPINEKWGRVMNNIRLKNQVDAALVKGGITYLFSGDQYYRYSGKDYAVVDEGYPKKISGWSIHENEFSLPDTFTNKICAAFTAKDGIDYLFSGNHYQSSKSGSIPKLVKDSWARVRNSIKTNNKMDAAFTAPDGKTYLFSGDQFYRYSGTNYTAVDEGYPQTIKGNWGELPESFCTKIDAAFTFKAGSVDRLYLFSGKYYVRYSGGNYSKIDAGYPKKLDEEQNPEGFWFEPIFHSNSEPTMHDRTIATIFTDQFNAKPRINFLYYGRDGNERLLRYEYDKTNYRWSESVLVSKLAISPFTSISAGFSGSNGKVYLFCENAFAEMVGNYEAITTPAAVSDTWGKIMNKFQDFNRVDATLLTKDGVTYLFCDTQYVKYSGDITPEAADFFVDESYPKTIATEWNNENCEIQLPATFKPEGFALFASPSGVIYSFKEDTFITSSNHQPVLVNEVWGRLDNTIEALNSIDTAFVHNNKTYLFCKDQYTRYSGGYSGYVDEGYPKKIAHIDAEDGLGVVKQFPDEIDAIMAGVDGAIYVFTGSTFVSSSDPSHRSAINDRFGIVRNNIAETGRIDMTDKTDDGILYLFSADQYIRYSPGSRTFVDEGYPKTIVRWKEFEHNPLPIIPDEKIKTCFTDHDGEKYFFAGNKFYTLRNPSETKLINSKWGKVRNNIQENGIVNAAFIRPDGKLYLFSADQYVRYSPDQAAYIKEGYPNATGKTAYVDEGFPKQISDNWGDLPNEFRSGVDAGFVFDGYTYLLKGETYVRYSDAACTSIDTGFPKNIALELNGRPEIRLSDARTFQQYKELSRCFGDSVNSIIAYLDACKKGLSPKDRIVRLSSVTGWQGSEIEFISTNDILSVADISDIQALTEMNDLFALAKSMGSLPSSVKKEIWDRMYGSVKDLKRGSSVLSERLRSVLGTSSWIELRTELHNKINRAKRDALLGYLIHIMEQTLGTEWIKNPRDLYEYLLIDVEMGEEATTSRIQEAIMCMQLFYHRTLMNLEDVNQETMLEVKEKLKKWWNWMKNYRVWEANRKVFLYPENYIRPELRSDKSPEFKELEEALLQGDISDNTVDAAYKTYLEKYGQISRLKIAGGYVYQRNMGDQDDKSSTAEALVDKKIFMFGYSNTEPKKYYYMSGDILEDIEPKTKKINQTIDWSSWKEIGITIDAERVYPVFSFNRLFVFWVELRERDQSSYSDSVGPENKVTQYDPVIYYSFHNLKGGWTNPQKMFDLSSYIDKTDVSRRALFIDDKKKIGKADYIPARDVLNGARLYVTNPITSRYYNAEEFIYISYEVRYIANSAAYEFTFEGKLKSNLEFEQGQVDSNIMDKLDKNIQFPFDKFGITPVSYSHWKGFYNDSFSAPWFSFNAAGGSFLIKPSIIPDAPVVKSNKSLYDMTWNNLPDSGFTDLINRKHLFYRYDVTTPGATQYYRVKDGDALSDPVPVTNVWGKRNILIWYPDGIECAAVNGEKTFIATTGNRYMSYTGSELEFVDQSSVEDTANPFSLNQILAYGATPESWHRVKEDLGDFLDTLNNVFVFSGDNNLYLVANPMNENGQAVAEYTIPVISEFWKELALLVTESTVAEMLTGWTAAQSACLYTQSGNKRLYITSGDYVFIKDYYAKTNKICTVIELTHPDLMATVYDETPVNAAEAPWIGVAQNPMEFITRLAGVGYQSGNFRLIAQKQDKTYEYTVPVTEELFDIVASIINDPAVSPMIASLTELSAADLYENKTIKRLYIRSGITVIIFDYLTGEWSVKNVSDLAHPNLFAKTSSLDGLLPSGPAVAWRDVAEDFEEYMSTVQNALVWKGVLYLLTPKSTGGFEYVTPSASNFWGAVAENLPVVKDFTSIDSSCVIVEGGNKRFMVTFNENVVWYDYLSGKWSLSTISKDFGIDFTKINGAILAPDDKVYLFSEKKYSEKINNDFATASLTSKWGFQTNSITSIVDAAFMDGDGRVYLFSGEKYVRYSNVNNTIIDLGYPKNVRADLGINLDEVRAEFSADINNVEIQNVGINTAFIKNLERRSTTGQEINEEKMYLFIDLTAVITRYIWKWRWRWWGGWRWHNKFGIITKRRDWWGWWWPEYYVEEQKETVRKSVYLRFSRTDEQFLMDKDYPKVITGNWSNLPGDFNKMITATFEDVEGSGDSEKDVFYVVRGLVEKVDGVDKVTNDYIKYTGKENFPREISEEVYDIIRLTSNTSEVLSQKLLIDDIDGLISLSTQETDELPKFQKRTDIDSDINDPKDESVPLTLKDNRKNDIVVYRAEYIKNVPSGNTLDFSSINGQYYWEIFFHAPMLIAQAFNNAQKFMEANSWYERIFDPTEKYDAVKKSFWKFLPFHEDIKTVQSDDVNNPAQYKKYLNDPFDPHAIARLRQIAYRKAVVMSYIDNLIDWGDMLFRQYTRETINEARMFYVLAYDLLGKKPELIGTRKFSDARTYQQLREEKNDLNMALIELENLPSNAAIPLNGFDTSPNGSLLDPYGYFYIPENREFADYWDRVEDRLYKIRYSLTIEGVKQKLSLFEPPIDVMALVKSVGSGMGLSQALADFNVAIPHYRFTFILSKARELTSRLVQFGQNLLSALEKKDAEELALLRNTHEKAILKLTLDIKNAQLQDSEETLKSLKANLKSAKIREAHYGTLIAKGLSSFESSQLELLASAQLFTNLSQIFSIASSIGGMIPEAGAFAFHWGGHNLGIMLSGISQAFNIVSSNYSYQANLSSILGGYYRRSQDWNLQQQLAKCDIENIERQIAGAEIKARIARLDIETAKMNIKNLESVDTFMKGKFTNLQLYRWMCSKLSGFYFQTYQMALDMAKAAEKSFQFELGLKESEIRFIRSLYWDSLRKGLLSGETL
ncbi:hypothetical protein JW979_14020, partial [bacterium]|nr:hypothetical protein [candidate division CSSED10-310 bacterium]